MDELATKVCCRCKAPKNPTDFFRDKGRVDGRAFRCSDCAKKVARTYKASDKGKAKALAWRLANPDRVRAHNLARAKRLAEQKLNKKPITQ
jgi:hypothetical protein